MQLLCKKKKKTGSGFIHARNLSYFHDSLHYLEFITNLIVSTKIEQNTCNMTMSKLEVLKPLNFALGWILLGINHIR